ncbi:hypothetical protein TNCV_1716021 [Trichonephila clavipes]|nr:hypothetical protein TNCV_1716021 [Trichonephila clavipes]
MANLNDQSFPPANLGRVDEEMVRGYHMVSDADCGVVGSGFEFRVRQGCLCCNPSLCDVCFSLTSIHWFNLDIDECRNRLRSSRDATPKLYKNCRKLISSNHWSGYPKASFDPKSSQSPPEPSFYTSWTGLFHALNNLTGEDHGSAPGPLCLGRNQCWFFRDQSLS